MEIEIQEIDEEFVSDYLDTLGNSDSEDGALTLVDNPDSDDGDDAIFYARACKDINGKVTGFDLLDTNKNKLLNIELGSYVIVSEDTNIFVVLNKNFDRAYYYNKQ